MDLIEQFSAGLADRVAAASFTVGIHGLQRPRSGILYARMWCYLRTGAG